MRAKMAAEPCMFVLSSGKIHAAIFPHDSHNGFLFFNHLRWDFLGKKHFSLQNSLFLKLFLRRCWTCVQTLNILVSPMSNRIKRVKKKTPEIYYIHKLEKRIRESGNEWERSIGASRTHVLYYRFIFSLMSL